MTQPRRLAVLAYLVLARPRGLHSRDTLVGLLWPESDQPAGRHALRNVLHALRRALGGDVIVTAGDGMVGVNHDHVACDALELARDLAEGRVDDALARYHGDLLQGFFVSDAPEFERWLDGERSRLRESLLARAWSLAEVYQKNGELERALRTARAAAAIAPDDELSLRRLLDFLDVAGDRSGAVRAYEEFATRLKREYDAEPSAETQARMRALRESTHVGAPVKAAVNRGVPIAASSKPGTAELPAPRDEPPTPASRIFPDVAERPRRRNLKWAVAGAAIVVLTVALGIRIADGSAPVASPPKKLVVLPMENATGDPRLDYVGAGLAEGIATRLEGIGGISVRSGARSDWPATTRHDFQEIGRQFGVVILLKTVLGKVGDSLVVRASVLDLASSGERPIASRHFTTGGLREMESDLAASVTGAVFRVPLPEMPRKSIRPVDPESYRLTLVGLHQLLAEGDNAGARESFTAATRIDPLNARAWAGLSSAINGREGNNLDEVESAAARALALDSLQGTALANIGLVRAFRYRNLADGLEWTQRAVAAEPSNPEIFWTISALYRRAWLWDKSLDALRIAERLDPLSVAHIQREAFSEMCAGRPARAIPLYRRVLARNAFDKRAMKSLVRALALLGHYDEALDTWRKEARISGDSGLIPVLGRANGQSGYWAARHQEGRLTLTSLENQSKAAPGTVSPGAIMRARFAAGDAEGGFRDIENLITRRSAELYLVPCLFEFDEVRDSERYKAVLRRIGPLSQR